ncbi:MAG: hypothetical protein KDF60_13420 [Calditrichaeota bacterium]|nr:hypothetical protein [Calditrichota bacterium]
MFSAGDQSNYKTDLKVNHVYFTALLDMEGLADVASSIISLLQNIFIFNFSKQIC